MAQQENRQDADVVVLGAGPAGYVCAIRLAQLGKKVTVIDRAEVGGVCLNRGCIPSKALIYAGSLYEKLSHAAELGIEVTGAKVNLPKLMQWKDGVVGKLTGGVAQLLKANGCTFVAGEAKFTGPRALEVKTASGTQTLSFNQLVIATGSRPAAIPGVEIDQQRIVDSTGALSLREIPRRMLCIGGGYIGLELGTFYAKIGTEVTVVEAFPNLLGMVDSDLTKVVQKGLEKRGVKIRTQTSVKSCKAGKTGVEVVLKSGDKEETAQYDVVLVTIGRVPNTESIGLDKAGLKADAKGFIAVDAQRRTSVPHIYAIGDIAGQPLLAHKGSKEGIVAAEAIAGLKTAYDIVAMPAVIFTDPEIATVGMTEAEARAQGVEVRVGLFPFAANGRALSVAEPDGLVKMIGDAKTGRLLGVHIVGAEASNLIAEAALALELGAMVEDLALTVHAHPTLPETLMEAAEATLGHAIHIFQRKPRAAQAQTSAHAQPGRS
ncbi:MAG: dihydrolipoyl dehydrogenase [Oligoflexia bacterium]|nr:dihydrolipoyl dehydrogenase [Oligoflexia bacterium]